MKLRTAVLAVAAIVLVLAGGYFALKTFVLASAEKKFMLVHKNGKATPAQFGAAWTPFSFVSGGRKLEASLVTAPSSCESKVALLIFHGRDESISDWAKAQAFLGRKCVSSVVFDYSGNGDSAGAPNVANLNADAVAAYAMFVQKFPEGRRCLLGHSMGNAPMLHAFPTLAPRPDCVVMANAFSSVEDFARTSGAPPVFAKLLSGVWDNTEAIQHVSVPLLVVHSDADKTIPAFMAKRLEAAAPAHAWKLTVHGFGHDALYENPTIAWWGMVLIFMRG
jgi:fermentation-respiration switch protein FrsA (DUF1100 family)